MIQPGDRFGLLTVVRELNKRTNRGERQYECVCDCGRMTTLRKSALTGNRPTRSCGCLRANGGRKSSAARRESRDYETEFAERISEHYGGSIEYVSGYMIGDAHCDVTFRCNECDGMFVRSRHRASRIKCPDCESVARFKRRFNDRYGHAFEYLGGYEGIGST
ncbi:MAG: hypothetical protein IKV48_07040, partial [Eggerthellaceae bacterium]|nr:hypothetical protein [Eggerthellaceae bacterium]